MRLIDADALLQELQEELEFDTPMYTEEQNKYVNMGVRMAIRDVKSTPTVDIKTEVAREIFAEIDIPLKRFMNEHDYSLGNLIFDVAELKNKYIKDGVGE